MKSWLRLTLTMLFAVCMAKAQLPVDFRSEQVYLNPQKHVYLPRDTIRIEGMVTWLAESGMRPYSNYLYVELFNSSDSVLLRQKLSCKEDGYFSTRMASGYEWPSGVYYLRAYTRFMRNFSLRSLPVQPFLLGKTFPARENRVYEAKCTLIPAGGSLVPDYLQTVVVRLTDDMGYPVQSGLHLCNTSGDTLVYVQTSLSGMAQLRFIPRKGTDYVLTGEVDGINYKFPLPAVSAQTKIQGSLNGKRLSYQVLHADTRMEKYRLYVYDAENGLSELPDVKANGIVMLEKAPSVLSLFLTTDGKVISEYTVASKYRQTVTLDAPDTLRVGDALRYRLGGSPTVSKVMVRVTDVSDRLASYAEGSMHYLSDYESKIPFPAAFYAETEVQRGNDLQAWMSVATFKRFRLEDVLKTDTVIYQHYPEQVLEFTGRVEKKNGYPFKEGTLLAYRSDGLIYDAPLDDKGHFRMAVDDFAEGESFFLQALSKKGKPDFADYHPDDEVYPPVADYRPFRVPVPRYAASQTETESVEISSYTDNGQRNYVFPNIVVKARLHMEEPEETNVFYSTNFANREKIEKRDFRTLLDILLDMPGITVQQGQPYDEAGMYDPELALSPKWTIVSNRGTSVLSTKNNNLPIIVDGTRYSEDNYDMLMKMPAFEIETVEFLRPWQTNAYVSGAVNGAIRVVTREYKDRPPLPAKGAMYEPVGLTPQTPYEITPWVASQIGVYRLIVDVFTAEGIQTCEHWFSVVE